MDKAKELLYNKNEVPDEHNRLEGMSWWLNTKVKVEAPGKNWEVQKTIVHDTGC